MPNLLSLHLHGICFFLLASYSKTPHFEKDDEKKSISSSNGEEEEEIMADTLGMFMEMFEPAQARLEFSCFSLVNVEAASSMHPSPILLAFFKNQDNHINTALAVDSFFLAPVLDDSLSALVPRTLGFFCSLPGSSSSRTACGCKEETSGSAMGQCLHNPPFPPYTQW